MNNYEYYDYLLKKNKKKSYFIVSLNSNQSKRYY